MPTYVYRCNDCSQITNAFHGIKDPPLTQCPYCRGQLTRMISGGCGIIFKGTGWYETDYKKKTGKKVDKPDG